MYLLFMTNTWQEVYKNKGEFYNFVNLANITANA